MKKYFSAIFSLLFLSFLFYFLPTHAFASTGTFTVTSFYDSENGLNSTVQFGAANWNPSMTINDCWMQIVDVGTGNYSADYVGNKAGTSCSSTGVSDNLFYALPDATYYVNLCQVINGNLTSTCWRSQNFDLVNGSIVSNPTPTPTPTPTDTPTPTQASTIYVTDDYDNAVSVFDESTYNKISTIPVGNEPRPIVALPTSHKLYVANTYGESISVIDTSTNTVSKTIQLASGETDLTLALNHSGTRLYASNWGSASTITVIDTTTDTILTKLTGFSGPQGMALSNDDSKLYVVNENCCTDNGFVSVVDTSNYSTLATIPVAQSATSIVLTPDGKKAYVSNNGGAHQGNTVAVIDTATNTVIKNITVEVNPYGIVTNSTGTRVYVVNTHYWDGNGTNNGTVSVIDTATDAVVDTITVGHVPNSLTISPDDSKLYVVNNFDNTMSVIDTSTNTVVNTINNIGNSINTHPYSVVVVGTNSTVTPTPTTTPTPTPSNQPPSVTWTTSTSTLNEGDTFTASGSFTDPDSTSWTATVNYGDGSGTQPLTLNSDKTFSLSHVYVDNGTYTITVSVTDNQGLTGTSTGSGGTITVNNPAPVISPITSPGTVDQNTTTTINVSYSDYGTQSHTATVDWGDGSGTQSVPVSGTDFSANHDYQNPGTYTVTVTVTDSLGATTTQALTITVINVPPQVGTIAVPSPVWVNDTVPLSVGFTDPGILDTHTATINWGDGMTSIGTVTENNGSGSVSGNHVYFAKGVYTITVAVTDKDGGVGTATKQITVNNRPPFVNPLSNAAINQGDTYTASGSFTDSDSSSWTATVDYGDGAGPQILSLNPDKTFNLSHQYNAAGIYTVTVVVSDDSGGTGTTSATVTVNAPPSINPITGGTINEGQTYTENGSFTDSDSTSWTATVDYGDGSGVQNLSLTGNNFSLNHLYKDNGAYAVTVKITDNQGATGTQTANVIVQNAKPVVGAITASVNPIQVNQSTTATASFTDPGVLDTHTAVFDWGDGMTSLGDITEANGSGSVSSDHVYLTAGVYTITVTVTDNDNGSGTSVFQYLSVYNPTPQGLFSGARIFTSPAGAYAANPNLSGQVQFGVTAKYDTNNQPTGNVSMNFKAANFKFDATGITVFVTASGKAILMGTGTINGAGNYNFVITGIDSTTDTIRFQITDPGNNNAVVYDSQPGAPITDDPTAAVTGQVIVH